MQTAQIYTLVNAVNKQAFGSQAITVSDPAGLISLGKNVLSSSTNTESFLNALLQRIGETIYAQRLYTNKLRDLNISEMRWGAILQKLSFKMPEAVADDAYNLVDGQSVDHYVVAKPEVDQKLFVSRAPYSFFRTTPMWQLDEAFTSESAMGAFISNVNISVRNAMEATLENLGRLTIATGVAEATGTGQAVHLVTEYNAASGRTVTAAGALLDPDFLRFAIRRIKRVSKGMTDMSELYNDGTITRHTPYEMQRLRVLSDFNLALETVVEYSAFNRQFVELNGFTELNYWQSATPGEEAQIKVKKLSDGTNAEINNVVAIIHDRDAMGIYQQFERTLTTPVNARAAYFNTFYHTMSNRLVDQSENLVYFTLD